MKMTNQLNLQFKRELSKSLDYSFKIMTVVLSLTPLTYIDSYTIYFAKISMLYVILFYLTILSFTKSTAS